MTDEQRHPKPTTETVPAHRRDADEDMIKDVASDPALNDVLGSDWTDEGGATTIGPATKTRGVEPDRES